MLRLALALSLAILPFAAKADSDVDRLYDAMGLPALLAAFAADGAASAQSVNDGFLGGQGGDVFAETVRRLYDVDRLNPILREGLKEALDAAVAARALVFFETEMGARIIRIEVEARNAMSDEALEAAAMRAADIPDPDVVEMLDIRDLVARNTDITLDAQSGFFSGMQSAAPGAPAPDIEGQRGQVTERTRAWITGYYMLVASALEEHDLSTYSAFWETDVGQALDEALFVAFEALYVDLSFALGQMVGRLMPQNEL